MVMLFKKKKPPSVCETDGGKKFPAPRYSPIVKFTVPSPLGSLTTVFGKGTCVSTPLWTPKNNTMKNACLSGKTAEAEPVERYAFFSGKPKKTVVKPHG